MFFVLKIILDRCAELVKFGKGWKGLERLCKDWRGIIFPNISCNEMELESYGRVELVELLEVP